jgi:hypothetical protein
MSVAMGQVEAISTGDKPQDANMNMGGGILD